MLLCAALLSGCGTREPSAEDATGNAGPTADIGQAPEPPLVTVDGQVMLSCTGSGPYFPASAMAGGIEGVADEAEVEAALRRLAAEVGIDAPWEVQRAGVTDAEWIVLGRETDEGTEELLLGMGPWGPDGPSDRRSQYVILDRIDGGWEASGWGDCNLEPVLPPGTSWLEMAAPPEGLDPAATSLEVEVSERECASARDPAPFLNEPVVVEREDSVTVYWTSESPQGDQRCPGNPSVRRVVALERPLGDRALLDGSTWPPNPVPGS